MRRIKLWQEKVSRRFSLSSLAFFQRRTDVGIAINLERALNEDETDSETSESEEDNRRR